MASGLDEVRQLTIGGVTKGQLLERLRKNSVSLNEYAEALFADDAFTTTTTPTTVSVVTVSLTDLGLPEGGTFDSILSHAARFELRPCPLELAPHLRLDYLDQPIGPYLTVASLELRPGSLTPNGFYLRHREDGLWLRGYESGPDNIYPPDFSDFAFIKKS